jgi:peptidoglycan-associated lipoprotein
MRECIWASGVNRSVVEIIMMYRQLVGLVAVVLFASACADEKKPVVAPAASAAPAETKPTSGDANNPKPDDDATKGNLNISDEIRKACGLTDSEAFFAFDSANVRPQDQKVLKKLADCFSTGALKGREMRLVGHADPRGSADYNLALGGKRADNVKTVIAGQGMSAKKIATSSRGAMDATGTDESSWAKDRRVDVTLGD